MDIEKLIGGGKILETDKVKLFSASIYSLEYV